MFARQGYNSENCPVSLFIQLEGVSGLGVFTLRTALTGARSLLARDHGNNLLLFCCMHATLVVLPVQVASNSVSTYICEILEVFGVYWLFITSARVYPSMPIWLQNICGEMARCLNVAGKRIYILV